MKRSKIIATICACVLCLGLLTVGVYAAVLSLNMDLTTQVSFNADGVYVDIDAQVYRGESYTELRALDATKYAASGKNYIIDEAGTTLGTPFTEWTPENVAFLPNARLVQYRIKFTNKSEVAISVIPAEVTTIPTNVTLKEESSETLLIEPAATAELRMNFTLADSVTTSFSNKSLKMNFEICKTSDIETNEAWFTMNSSTPTQLDGLTDAYKSSAPRVLRVPETVGGNKVVSTVGSDPVSDYAFLNYVQNTKYVILPSTLETIGTYSFYICKFKGIYLPKSLKSIMGSAFQSCTMLGSICLPEWLTNMGGPYDVSGYTGLFSTCTSLLSVVIPSSLTSICGSAFSGCTSLASVTIQNGVTSIGDSAFSSCSSLTSITIPSSVTSIGDYAFDGCTSLTSITIPSSVTSIESHAFRGCTALKSVYMEGSAPAINYSTFGYSSSAPYTNSGFKIYVKSANLSGYQPTGGYSTSGSSVNNWYYYNSNGKITTY